MTKPSGAHSSFFSSDLDPIELERILQRIDENLALRQTLREQESIAAPDTLLSLPEIGDAPIRLQTLRSMQAPLFVVGSHGWRNLVKRAINLPLKLIHHKQIIHNRELLAVINTLLIQVQGLRQYTSAFSQMYLAERQRLEQQGTTIAEQGATIAEQGATIAEQGTTIAEQGATLSAQQEQLARMVAAERSLQAWLDLVAKDQHSQSEWIAILQSKLSMLALDVREHIDGGVLERTVAEPKIRDLERFRARLATMANHVRINLGSGERPLPDYINIDYREMPDVDVVADARRLPFEPGTVAEISSAHLVEHFREHQLRTQVLPYWRQLLQPGGCVRIICPNWAAMLARVHDGRMSLHEFKLLTFGAQDYVGDDHFAMYTPESLAMLCEECGFERVEVLATERMNGICPEMELVAYR